MSSPVRYYRVNAKNNRAYWCPTPVMRALGFEVSPLGFDGREAKERAAELNARWQAVRRERPEVLGPRLDPRPAGGKSFVYFLQAGNRIKIGYSHAPFARAGDVAGAAHDPLIKVVIVPGTRRDEKQLHKRFQSYRTNGEWFVAARPIQLTLVRSAMAGRVVHDGEDSVLDEAMGTKVEPQAPFSPKLVESRVESRPSQEH